MPPTAKVPSTFELNGLMLDYASRLLLGHALTRSLHAPTQRRMGQAVPIMSTHGQLREMFELIRTDGFQQLAEAAQLLALEARLEDVLSPMEKLELESALREEFFRQVA